MSQINDGYITRLMELVNQSHFPQHMRMRLSTISMDHATITLDTDQCHLQPFGIVHGGAIATLIDTATFWSAFLRLPEDAGLVNIDLKLNYLKSIRSGRMVAEGRCLRAGRSINYAEARVMDAKGQLVAHGTSSLMVLPGKGIDVGVSKFVLME
jgi:uncharacterized protein (TIGR00369 family)